MSRTVRVRSETYQEVQGASRLLGRTPAELLARAWDQFRHSEEFAKQFHRAQQAILDGDLAALAADLDGSADAWVEEAVDDVRRMRRH